MAIGITGLDEWDQAALGCGPDGCDEDGNYVLGAGDNPCDDLSFDTGPTLKIEMEVYGQDIIDMINDISEQSMIGKADTIRAILETFHAGWEREKGIQDG